MKFRYLALLNNHCVLNSNSVSKNNGKTLDEYLNCNNLHALLSMHLVVLSLPCIKSSVFDTVSSTLSTTDGEGENYQYFHCVFIIAQADSVYRKQRCQLFCQCKCANTDADSV